MASLSQLLTPATSHRGTFTLGGFFRTTDGFMPSGTYVRVSIYAGTILTLYVVGLIIYRLWLSPIASFLGPKLAAVTSWYEFYYDAWCNGQYIFKVQQMHERYGPIMRINPEELSIHDPEFYNEVYVTESRRRTDAYEVFCKGIDFDGSVPRAEKRLEADLEGSHLLTTDHDLHRRRRKPLEPFFSRMGISRLQSMLASVALKLVGRLEALKGTGSVIRLDHAFSAFSGDIIGRICWENEREFLDHPDFEPEWYDLIHMIVRSIPLFTGFPSLVRLVSHVPEKLLLLALPSGQTFMKFKSLALEHVAVAKREKQASKTPDGGLQDWTSVFRHIVNSDMPQSELSDERLAKEAQVLLGGGTASTARTLGFASYYILARRDIRERLQEELRETMVGWPEHIPSWADLERLPFLQALIKESLRLSYGVMHRLPRCSPDVPIRYKGWTIPIGVPIGMSAYLMQSNPAVYPDPDKFVPERWLGEIDPAMHKSFVPFCRGSRNCLGQNLALAEMSLALAVLYRPDGPKLELYETDESDVKQAHDFMIPLPKLDTKGVRVRVL